MVVVDASVILKWLVRDSGREESTDKAIALMDAVSVGRLAVIQPFHWLAEVAAVLTRISPKTAAEDVVDLHALCLPTCTDPIMLHRACQLAARYRVHVFDSLYHAVALENPGATLITADKAYFNLAKPAGKIALLADWPVDKGRPGK